jgi:hypothetical protein
VIEVNEGIRRPDLLAQFFAGDYFARMLQKNAEDLQRLVLQPDPGSVAAQFSTLVVQFECTKANYRM